jgi:hypothetical protein
VKQLFIGSAPRNGDLEVPVYFLKVKQGYVRKIEKYKLIHYILVNAGMKFGNKKKFRYGIPAYASAFRALLIGTKRSK